MAAMNVARFSRVLALYVVVFSALTSTLAQIPSWMPDPTKQQTYTLHRSSSREATGANADYRTVTPGQTLTILDVAGSGMISHVWFTLNAPEPYSAKRIVLRMYWDDETTPSVETPIGDFFGLGNGMYYMWQSPVLSVGNDHAMNCWFPMPYAKHARITVTNEGKFSLNNLYYNVDYRTYPQPLPKDTLYFHAQYRQAQPNKGWTNNWYDNGDPHVVFRRNLDGKDNYEFLNATGHGQLVGVTMSITQNQDGWWGEGNDLFEIDSDPALTMVGTGSEDYFLGAWDFGSPQQFALHGSPVVNPEVAGSRWSVYRFHLDSPVPFNKSLRFSIEHGHANVRSDNFYSVAYWYQTEPHAAFPPLPEMSQRIPVMEPVGGPGNAGASTAPASGPEPK